MGIGVTIIGHIGENIQEKIVIECVESLGRTSAELSEGSIKFKLDDIECTVKRVMINNNLTQREIVLECVSENGDEFFCSPKSLSQNLKLTDIWYKLAKEIKQSAQNEKEDGKEPQQKTAYAVVEGDENNIVEVFDTEEEAHEYINSKCSLSTYFHLTKSQSDKIIDIVKSVYEKLKRTNKEEYALGFAIAKMQALIIGYSPNGYANLNKGKLNTTSVEQYRKLLNGLSSYRVIKYA